MPYIPFASTHHRNTLSAGFLLRDICAEGALAHKETSKGKTSRKLKKCTAVKLCFVFLRVSKMLCLPYKYKFPAHINNIEFLLEIEFLLLPKTEPGILSLEPRSGKEARQGLKKLVAQKRATRDLEDCLQGNPKLRVYLSCYTLWTCSAQNANGTKRDESGTEGSQSTLGVNCSTCRDNP